jgi:glucokinase
MIERKQGVESMQPSTSGAAQRVLAGDIGGTKVNVGLFSLDSGRPVPLEIRTYSSKGHRNLEEIVEIFLGETGPHQGPCCFGVAGPVVNGKCFTTNLPWVVSEQSLKSTFGFSSVSLINDLVATAEAIAVLDESDFHVLNSGISQPNANMGLLAAGTGLGVALLVWNGKEYLPVASEGGHADFAPVDPLQVELWFHLRKKFGHVSCERVVSGPGLVHIYDFLREKGETEADPETAAKLESDDPSRVIAEAALSGRCRLCVSALDLFVQAYGAEAGNLALRAFTVGSMFLGGGIAPKILGKLTDRAFMKAFVAKGRLGSTLSKIPVKIILNDKAALLGAARRGFLQD